MNSRDSQELLNSVKKSTTDAIKITSKRAAIQKTVEATGDLTLTLVGLLGIHFEGGREVNYSLPCLKLVRIMLKTSNTHISSFRKYSFQYQGFLNFADVIIFCKNSSLLANIVPLLKAVVWELCYRFFSCVFSFCKTKGYF